MAAKDSQDSMGQCALRSQVGPPGGGAKDIGMSGSHEKLHFFGRHLNFSYFLN